MNAAGVGIGRFCLGAFLGLLGCTDNLAVCIDTTSEPAITVQIRDAVTGTAIAAGARGAIRDGSYIDSLRPRSADASGRLLALAAGVGRPGTYAVTIVHPGYQPWQQPEVGVNTNSCGLWGRLLVADLEPLP